MNSARTRVCALAVASVTALALLVPGVGGAGATANTSPDAAASTAPANRPVLSSEFGEARSTVFGFWGDDQDRQVRGWFKPRRFQSEKGELMAVGRLHAKLLRPNGTVRDEVDKRVVIPVRNIEAVGRVQQQPATCQILRLVLGPLDLDLLGLHVHLNRVVLVIEAHPGPGNLLGNLLCAIAGLLDETGVLNPIRQILNAVLGLLRL